MVDQKAQKLRNRAQFHLDIWTFNLGLNIILEVKKIHNKGPELCHRGLKEYLVNGFQLEMVDRLI